LVITLLSHEKNLGIFPLTDYIVEKLGKDNCVVLGSNYLIKDNKSVVDLINESLNNNKNIIIKYIIPKQKFSNQAIDYPSIFEEKSDLVLRVPKFMEEMMKPVPLEILKGQDNPFILTIGKYYGNE
jgi:hypothetical protein